MACLIDMLGHYFLGHPYLGYDSWREFAGVAAQNFAFAFGFYRPGETEMVVGGWSIGIEWTFYAFFPLMLVMLDGRLGRMLALLALALVVAALAMLLSALVYRFFEKPFLRLGHRPK